MLTERGRELDLARRSRTVLVASIDVVGSGRAVAKRECTDCLGVSTAHSDMIGTQLLAERC